MQRFFSLDVETANPALHSICQIGIVGFEGNKVFKSWGTLVNPEDYFSRANSAIHGITEEQVVDSPKFPVVAAHLCSLLEGMCVVSHTTFDRSAMRLAFEMHGLSMPSIQWLDSSRVVRRAWPEFQSKGYGLKNVCEFLGINFKHHDALEDAKAAGLVLLAAIEHSGVPLSEWIARLDAPRTRQGTSNASKPVVNPDGDWFGEVLVFTGQLQIPRKIASEQAAFAGCRVDSNVTKETTILVVGDQDVARLAGNAKSSKHRKAEDLIAKGQEIRILQESDFERIVTD